MAVSNYYTAADAIARLEAAGLSESTFYRWVREGVISKELPKGRQRGALYPRDQVEEAINHDSRRGDQEHPERASQDAPQHGMTDWITASDLPYVLALDYELYGPEGYVDMSITRAWWERNPYMCRILFDGIDRKFVWGALTVMPLDEATIIKLLKDELHERDIKPDDILTYEKGIRYYGYVASAAIRPQYRQHFRVLLQSILDFWCTQYPDVQLIKLYAYAASDEGLGLMKHLFFSPRYDLGDNAYELDPHRFNPSRVIQHFQQCIAERRREQADEG